MTYYYGGYNCYGYNKYGYDRDGYNKYGRDCDGYDRGGYDKGGYDRGGRDCDGYDKGGYDCYGYDRGGYDCDGYDRDGKDCDGKSRDDDCGCDGAGSGDACEVVEVTLLSEDFDGGYCAPAEADGVVSDDNWLVKNGAAFANGCKDGELVFAEVDAAQYDSVTVSFDLKAINICNWETDGCYADEVVVEMLVDGAWVVLDVFERDGNVLVGSETGQEVSGSWTGLSYTLTDVSDDMQLRVTADMSASDEKLKLDNVLITATDTIECDPAPCGEEVRTSMLLETFDGTCVNPDGSENVVSDGGWLNYYDSAYTDGCRDGSLVFAELDTSDCESVEISFDMAVGNICNWEAADAAYGDSVTVEVKLDGAWVLLDVFSRDGYTLVGSETGQVVADGAWSDVSYTIDGGADDLQLRITSDISAQDEYLWLDNVDITCVTFEPCVELGSLGDYVWVDADLDGQQGAGEIGVAGVEVELFLDGVSTGRTTTTDADGFYLFEDLEAGDYNVVFTAIPEGYAFTLQNLGDDASDSDVDVNGVSDVVSLGEGEDYRDLDAGIYDLSSVVVLGSLGDYVWIDADRDGIQDAGEAGVEGVIAELFLDGVSTGLTTTTDANGFYLFDELEAGNYSVQFSATPAGYEFTAADQGGDDLADSDADASGQTGTYALAEGEDYMGLDAGLVLTRGSIGDTVWFDDDRDGVQDAGEAGVEGATVELFLDGVSTGRTTTTDASGFYLFDELDAGNYSVLVSGTPEGYEFTAADQGGDNLADSDVDASGASETYALAQGEDYMGLDAGIVVTLPTVAGDELDTCWNVTKTIDVLANDDAGLTITQIDGQDIAVGGSVAVSSGATVTLNADGTLTYDGTAVWTELGFGTMGMEMFTYTAENALGGAATAMVDVHVCADNIRTLEDINDIKPDVIEFTIDDLYLQSLEGFVVDVNVVDTGDADLDAANDRFELTASTDVFCIDVNGEVLDDVTLQAELFLADENDASLSEYVVNVHNLDLVTYILNQDYVSQGYSITDVQNAIWNLTDDLFILFDPNASAIVADAQANGEGFEAGEGDLVGLIIAPIQEVDPVTGEDTSDYQNFIYGVEYQTFTECLCV